MERLGGIIGVVLTVDDLLAVPVAGACVRAVKGYPVLDAEHRSARSSVGVKTHEGVAGGIGCGFKHRPVLGPAIWAVAPCVFGGAGG